MALALSLAVSSFSLSSVRGLAADGTKEENTEIVMELSDDNGPVSSIMNAYPVLLNSTTEIYIDSVGKSVEGREELQYDGVLASAVSFNTTVGNSYYRFTYSNPYFKSPVTFELYDQNKIKMDVAGGSETVAQSTSKTVMVKLNPNSTYYVVAYTNNGSGYAKTPISIGVESSPDLAGDSKEEASVIGIGDTIASALDGYADVDFFTFTTGPEKAFYSLDVIDVSVPEISVVLYDANMQELFSSGFSANSSTSTSKGLIPNSVYYVKIYGRTHEDVGDYKVMLTSKIDDVNDTMDTALAVSIGKGYDYALQSDKDEDAFKFVPEHTSATIKLTNNSDSTALTVKLLDPLSNKVAQKEVAAKSIGTITWLEFGTGKNYYAIVSGSTEASYNLVIDYCTQTITYELNGGVNSDENPAFYYLGSKVSLKDPTRDGYDFLGWYTKEDLADGYQITGISETDDKPITVYAKWQKSVANPPTKFKFKKGKKKNQVIVTFKKGSGTKGTEIKYSQDKRLTGAKKKTVTGTSATLIGFKWGKVYYVQFRSYYKSGSSKVWSKKTLYKAGVKLTK